MGQFSFDTSTWNIIMSDAKPVKKAAKPKKPAEHPKCSVMIAAAITALKDRKGSSLAAIKKYIGANCKVDLVKLGPHLKLAVKKGIEKKTLVQVKGKGAAGSFKLGKVEKPKKVKKPKKPKAEKPKKAKKPKTPKKKKPAAKKAKKSPAKKAAKKPAAKKPAAKKPAAKKPAKKAAP